MITNEQIETLKGKFKNDAPVLVQANNGKVDVEAYLNFYGIRYKVKQNDQGTLYALDECVFDPSHTANESSIIQLPDGKLLYQCFHNSCQGRKWENARQIISGKDSLAQFMEGGTVFQKKTVKHFDKTSQIDLSNRIKQLSKESLNDNLPAILEAISTLPTESEKSIFIQQLFEKTGIPKQSLLIDLKAYRQVDNKKITNNKTPLFEEIEPWETQVTGEDILNNLYAVIKSHVVLNQSEIVSSVLWIVTTYCYDSFRVLPMLAITSPEKRCGKTTLLEVLAGLTNKPLLASNISAAAIFRTIEKHSPCLLIDEADTFLRDNDELRGIVNSGHTKKSAFVIRVNTETLEPERFSTWGPKAISLIGSLPDTLVDRSISIKMKRKNTSEKTNKINHAFDEMHLDLRRMIKRWTQDNVEVLKNVIPITPETGNDRATDNWLPLLSIADLVGGEWPMKTRTAMIAIEQVSDTTTIKQTLLIDIKEIFGTTEKTSSKELVEKLVAIEDHPWGEWRHGKSITQNGLAHLLRPFEILPKTIRIGDGTAKGYVQADFKDSFERYLIKEAPPVSPILTVTTTQLKPVKDLQEISNRNTEEDVTVQNQRKPIPVNECVNVTVENPLKGGYLIYSLLIPILFLRVRLMIFQKSKVKNVPSESY